MNPYLLVLIAATAVIGLLCWIWMRNSRASQTRMETLHARTIALLEEQNALLRKLAEK